MPRIRLVVEASEPLRSELRVSVARIRAWMQGVEGVKLRDEDLLALEQLYQALTRPND